MIKGILRRIWEGGKPLKFHYELKSASLPKRAQMLRPLFYHLGDGVELHILTLAQNINSYK